MRSQRNHATRRARTGLNGCGDPRRQVASGTLLEPREGASVARVGETSDLLKCSFCGKSQKQVKKLIAGPGVYICDECIDLCNEIIEEELSQSSEVRFDELPKPREIYQYLNDYVIGQDQAKKILEEKLS